MAAADELYLLYQKCNDLQQELIASWNKHFEWLNEVVDLAREAQDQPIIPKTPMTRRGKRKKVESEISDGNGNTILRKSSRAAAKAAAEKTKRVIEATSNIGTKLRRPSTPKKYKPNSPKNEKRVAYIDKISEIAIRVNEVKVESGEKSVQHDGHTDSGIGAEKEESYENGVIESKEIEITSILQDHLPNREAVLKLQDTDQSAENDNLLKSDDLDTKAGTSPAIVNVDCVNMPLPAINIDAFMMPPPTTIGLSMKVNQKQSTNIAITDDLSNQVVVSNDRDIRPVRSTRTKHQIEQNDSQDQTIRTNIAITDDLSNQEVVSNDRDIRPVRSTRTKRQIEQNDSQDQPIGTNIATTDDLSNQEVVSNDRDIRPVRSTRTKRQIEQNDSQDQPIRTNIATTDDLSNQEVVSNDRDIRPVRSTRTKRQIEQNDSQDQPIGTNIATTDDLSNQEVVSNDRDIRPVRSTRTKRQIEQNDSQDQPVRITRTKKRKMEDEANKENSLAKTDVEIQTPRLEVCQRITRSKIRLCEQTEMSPKKRVFAACEDSPSKNALPSKRLLLRNKINEKNVFCREVVARVQEVNLENSEVTRSPVRIIRHPKQKDISGTIEKANKMTPVYQMPLATSSLYKARIRGNCNSNNSGCNSSSQKRPLRHISSASPIVSNSKPTKLTREELDERKQEDLRRKKEKQEETRRKKEEILKLRVEEQKRKNEERMRRVQVTREAREKKVAETRELLEREKRLREERFKEERLREEREKRLREERFKEERLREEREKKEERLREEREKKNAMAAKKAEEEAKLQRAKEQEEKKKLEEQHRLEEERRKEDKRLKLEEQKRILEEKREKERLAREELERQRVKEEERIEREKMELQRVKEREEAITSNKENLNDSYAENAEEHPANVTFSKPPETQSYEITPALKKPPKKKSNNPDDYGIKDLKSDDSTDEERAPKKQIPFWAKGDQLRTTVFNQEYYPPDVDVIFPAKILLVMPNLGDIFVRKRSRFFKRTSSAVWNTPPYKVTTGVS